MIIRENTFGYSQRRTEQTCAFNWKLTKMYPTGAFTHEGDSDIETQFPRDQGQPEMRSHLSEEQEKSINNIDTFILVLQACGACTAILICLQMSYRILRV